MGIGKNGFYTADDILKCGCKINWIHSDRNDGKSYDIKYRALKRAWETGKASVGLIRRNVEDIKPTTKIEKYFIERNKEDNVVPKITNGEYTHISARAGDLYFARYNDKGKEERGLRCGEYFTIATAERYKSTGHECEDIICEEIITDGIYLNDEPELLMHLISTICRGDDENVRVWLIGNTLSMVCPYFTTWGINPTQLKIGSINVYEFQQLDGSTTKIAVEYSKPRPDKKSKLFFGKAEKSIQGGEWRTREFPHLPKPLKEYSELYCITYKSSNLFSFTLRLLIDDNGAFFVFVHPAKHTSERVLTAQFSENPRYTPCLNPEKHIEVKYHNLYIDNKYVYCDNMTGQQFTDCINAEKKFPL